MIRNLENSISQIVPPISTTLFAMAPFSTNYGLENLKTWKLLIELADSVQNVENGIVEAIFITLSDGHSVELHSVTIIFQNVVLQ